MCYFTAIGIKNKHPNSIKTIESKFPVLKCKNKKILSISENHTWYWILDNEKNCSCKLFSQNKNPTNILSLFKDIIDESYSLFFYNHFYKNNPDEEKLNISKEIKTSFSDITQELHKLDDIPIKLLK